MCFVGEWYGDTGDAAFMLQLQSDYQLKHRIALPNWSDTAHELTIWQRWVSGTLYRKCCPRVLGMMHGAFCRGYCAWPGYTTHCPLHLHRQTH